MRTGYYKLLKISNGQGTASTANFELRDNIETYVMNILTKTANANVERKYEFNPDLRTTRGRINELLTKGEDERNTTILEMGNHLARIEKNFNDTNQHLKGKIPDGMLLVAYVDMQTDEGEYKIVILKSDYDVFIADVTGQQSTGLSVRNQIFKTCQFNVRRNEQEYEIWQISASDSTNRQAAYWLKDFLELKPIRQDKENTEKAYEQIKKKILNPIMKDHKPDYLILYNSTIAYMRQNGMFNLDYYKDEIIGKYKPFDRSLDIEALKNKVDGLRNSDKFDAQFRKEPSAITDKVKAVIKLTDEIDLKIKHNIPSLESQILPYKKGNSKGITIISKEGYEYAQGLGKRTDNDAV